MAAHLAVEPLDDRGIAGYRMGAVICAREWVVTFPSTFLAGHVGCFPDISLVDQFSTPLQIVVNSLQSYEKNLFTNRILPSPGSRPGRLRAAGLLHQSGRHQVHARLERRALSRRPSESPRQHP